MCERAQGGGRQRWPPPPHEVGRGREATSEFAKRTTCSSQSRKGATNTSTLLVLRPHPGPPQGGVPSPTSPPNLARTGVRNRVEFGHEKVCQSFTKVDRVSSYAIFNTTGGFGVGWECVWKWCVCWDRFGRRRRRLRKPPSGQGGFRSLRRGVSGACPDRPRNPPKPPSGGGKKWLEIDAEGTS